MKPEKIEFPLNKVDKDFLEKVRKLSVDKLSDANTLPAKEQRQEAMDLIFKDLSEKLITEDGEYTEGQLKSALHSVEKDVVRKMITDENKRVDGRGFDDLRDLSSQVSVLPRTHGSGLFTRGQTQSLCVTTLGTSSDEQIIDALEGESYKHFMLHYNFPPFSVGEVKPFRGPGRREIGHGALAERALKPVIPDKEKFPYTIRVVSDILESNGSSSMATVCAGSLALMDAGVPVVAPVAGVALGLIEEGDKRILLTDIGGVEDHYGDMDFKVAGTDKGITAIQLDLKIRGISIDLLKKGFAQSAQARNLILENMKKAIETPKDSISEYAPRIVTLTIKQEVIKDLIGPGGKTIKKIIADTGVSINVEDDGKVQVASTEETAMEKALEIVKMITQGPEIGKLYKGRITRIMNFGAFCEIFTGKEGLIHVSELADRYVKNVEDVVKVGDEVLVKVIEIDDQGRINLSRKRATGSEKDKVKG
jgi:polyribonucleotide nucleotidyltransferase